MIQMAGSIKSGDVTLICVVFLSILFDNTIFLYNPRYRSYSGNTDNKVNWSSMGFDIARSSAKISTI